MYSSPAFARWAHTLEWEAAGKDGASSEAHFSLDSIVFNAFAPGAREDADADGRLQVCCTPDGWRAWVYAVRAMAADEDNIEVSAVINSCGGFLKAVRHEGGVWLSSNGKRVWCDDQLWDQLTAGLSVYHRREDPLSPLADAEGTHSLAERLHAPRTSQ